MKKEFCPSTETVELFVPNPQYPVSTELAVSSTKLAHSLSCDEESVLVKSHTLIDITDLLYFEPYLHLNKQCLLELYSMSCPLSPRFIECAASSVCVTDFCKVFDYFCTVLNVPPHKLAIDSRSSHYHKAVMMFQVWKSMSEGTYQYFRKQIDEYSVFSRRNILVRSVTVVFYCSVIPCFCSSIENCQHSTFTRCIGHPWSAGTLRV